MKYSVALGGEAKKAISSKKITTENLLESIDKFIYKIEGKDVNLDSVKLHGVWRGFYRIRVGDLRIILRPVFPSLPRSACGAALPTLCVLCSQFSRFMIFP